MVGLLILGIIVILELILDVIKPQEDQHIQLNQYGVKGYSIIKPTIVIDGK